MQNVVVPYLRYVSFIPKKYDDFIWMKLIHALHYKVEEKNRTPDPKWQ
jgi:hypothetical protein